MEWRDERLRAWGFSKLHPAFCRTATHGTWWISTILDSCRACVWNQSNRSGLSMGIRGSQPSVSIHFPPRKLQSQRAHCVLTLSSIQLKGSQSLLPSSLDACKSVNLNSKSLKNMSLCQFVNMSRLTATSRHQLIPLYLLASGCFSDVIYVRVWKRGRSDRWERSAARHQAYRTSQRCCRDLRTGGAKGSWHQQ